VQNFRDLRVWQKSHHLTLAVYQITAKFPREELYGLTSQLRRASSSIPANLAEGCGRKGNPELAHFCHVAMGSANELENHLLLANDLKLLEGEDYEELTARTVEVKRMLAAFLQRLKSKN
jgi:four helix bundle protein